MTRGEDHARADGSNTRGDPAYQENQNADSRWCILRLAEARPC